MVHHAAQEGHAGMVKLVVEDFKLDPAARDKVSVYILGLKVNSQVSCKVYVVVYIVCGGLWAE